MSHPRDAKEEDNLGFKWGKKRGVRMNEDIQFFESFTYEGVEYFLYDCVYLWREGEPEYYIGKIVKIWELPNKIKNVGLVWFFRPIEIRNFLGDKKPLENEIFLASGEGTGLYDVNPPEAIIGKCNVVCTSKDKRNHQASEVELRRADFIFCRTFDVERCTLLDIFPDTIAGIKLECFFNRKKDQELISPPKLKPNLKERAEKSSSFSNNRKKDQELISPPKLKPNLKVRAEKSSSFSKYELDTVGNAVKDGKSGSPARSENRPLKKRKHLGSSSNYVPNLPSNVSHPSKSGEGNDTNIMQASKTASKDDVAKFSDPLPRLPDHRGKIMDAKVPVSQNRGLSKGVIFHEKAGKISDKASSQLSQDKGVKPDSKVFEVSRTPNIDTRRWFKQLPWEERMQRAHEQGTLVLLENLDPSYVSAEVEDIICRAFNERVEAKIIERSTFSSPHYGKAFVIFKSKDAADSAISKLNRGCLMLPNERPLLGFRKVPRDSGTPAKFVGHLVIDKIRLQRQREEMRDAISTSHCSQPNTIEYDMAVEWCVLQEKSDRWWKALHEQQAKEIKVLRSQFKGHRNK